MKGVVNRVMELTTEDHCDMLLAGGIEMVFVILVGTRDEMEPALKALGAKAEPVEAHDTAERQETAGQRTIVPETGGWTDYEMLDVWRCLSLGCRNVLRTIAKEPEGMLWQDICAALELSPYQVGGSLSSLGGIMTKEQYKDHRRPLLMFTRGAAWGYKLIGAWLDWLLRQTEELLAS